MKNKRLFIDMDGVLSKFNFDITPPYLYKLKEKGYFLNRPEHENIVNAVHYIYTARDDYEIYILSAVFYDAKYALGEKHDWLDIRTPEIDKKHRVFTICGQDKISYVPGFDTETDILIDDFGENCRAWHNAGGTYIKVSVDADDAAYEATKHDYVVHPEMSVEEIIAIIDKTSEDMDCRFSEEKEFDIEYIETYSGLYTGIRGKNYEDAVERLDQMIRDGFIDGPENCISSEYINRTGGDIDD